MLDMARPLRYLLENERLKELGLQADFRWSTVWLNTLGECLTLIAVTIGT